MRGADHEQSPIAVGVLLLPPPQPQRWTNMISLPCALCAKKKSRGIQLRFQDWPLHVNVVPSLEASTEKFLEKNRWVHGALR